ncbi:hypothetical protein [Curtobacterium sp. MCSS17_008]|uniref:hypothetical protein n=1 Tax=Curtobacterium sp. MCSS17_008 TaxID=2175647 RepID=UPI0011B4E980|nr:hypothetical protein [Curtobacterium sp. MCSS17_008]
MDDDVPEHEPGAGNTGDEDMSWREQLRAEQEHAREDVRAEDVALQPVAPGQWSVVNTAATDEVFGLLGFVGRSGRRYRVTFMSEPGGELTVSSREAARTAFVTT